MLLVQQQRLVLTLKEAAAQLTVTTRTLYNLIRAGEIKPRRIGSRQVIPTVELERFLKRDHKTGMEGKVKHPKKVSE